MNLHQYRRFSARSVGRRHDRTTYPDGSTSLRIAHRDGSAYEARGTAEWPVRYEYGIEQIEGVYRPYTKVIRLGADPTHADYAAEWVKSYTDLLGRTFLTVYPDGASERQYFDSLGRVWKSVDADGVVMLYQYNDAGEQEYRAVDLNRNDSIDFAGGDRITRTVSDVTTRDSYTVRRSRTWVWDQANTDAGRLVSTSESAVTGDRSWQTRFGLTHTTVTVYNGNGQVTSTSTAPNGAYAVSVSLHSRPVSATRYDSDDVQLGATAIAYDTHGRQYQVTDARTGTTTYT